MCLAIPGKVISTHQAHGLPMARVQFGALTREACLSYVAGVEVGDFVLVHVGFAISTVNAAEAERTYALLESLNQLGELDAPVVGETSAADLPVPHP